ncbi:hypothetical protein LX83_002793 [Goodfellowiella coeruleoviolacea]|uniref:DUF3592 domain-containing protein n=1 Tax=Goodfellowiella coeruleoviolacea TaxID=334858 RepID=A0AAE3KGZ4_9PSEU|nr:hypothetical protein [Goodfellowiella coeruleoviolacea]
MASWVLLVIAMLVTLEGGVVLTACWWDDIAINNHLTRTTAVVESVTFNRTVIRFTSPEGVEYRPSQGVLYPRGLEEGQMVRIEYDADNPELARVAGRTAALALLPVGTTLLGVWLVAGALLWWLRRPGMPRTARAAQTP